MERRLAAVVILVKDFELTTRNIYHCFENDGTQIIQPYTNRGAGKMVTNSYYTCYMNVV